MHNLKKILCLAALLLTASLIIAQPDDYDASNAHSHNDYLNDQAFHRAYNNGFGSIEADIFAVNGVLCVAHSKKEIDPQRTLKSLYLDPLLNRLKSDDVRLIKLLVDIKEDYKTSLDLLIKELKPLKKYLSGSRKKKALTILISGARPAPGEYKNYPDYILFDDDLKQPHSTAGWKRVGQVSLRFSKYTRWKGKGEMETRDKRNIRQVIDSVHRAGKTIRFWDAPDSEASWELQMQLGVDLIGTDKINELSSFLQRRRERN
jgi:alkaline phosphatase